MRLARVGCRAKGRSQGRRHHCAAGSGGASSHVLWMRAAVWGARHACYALLLGCRRCFWVQTADQLGCLPFREEEHPVAVVARNLRTR